MKPQFKLSQRLLSILLTAVMLWSCCSQTIEVFADSISSLVPENATNNPYNQDVVDAMQALCTEGEDAVEILDTLYSYGLIDETGNVVTNGTFSVVENSESLTLTDAQLVALAAERKAQGLSESTITIDGTELTWAQIETLLNIRDTVGALQDWMSTGERFDDDDMDMMDSLASELAADGLELEGFGSSAVKMMALNPASTNLTANTMNHNARVTVSFANSNISDADQDITVNISVSPVQTDYPISFDVQAVSGTGTLSVNCVLTLFTDLDMKGWYHNGIHFCVDHNYMSGYGNGFFGPGDAVSRAMIVQILYNMEGKPAVDEKSSFKDVPENAWYADAIAWAEDNKIVGGYGDGLFRPGDNVTREQLAAIFYGYAKYKGLDVSARNDLNVFTDGTTASTWAADMLKWATAIKLMSGKGNGLLDPKGKATRAEAATIILNMYNVVQ